MHIVIVSFREGSEHSIADNEILPAVSMRWDRVIPPSTLIYIHY